MNCHIPLVTSLYRLNWYLSTEGKMLFKTTLQPILLPKLFSIWNISNLRIQNPLVWMISRLRAQSYASLASRATAGSSGYRRSQRASQSKGKNIPLPIGKQLRPQRPPWICSHYWVSRGNLFQVYWLRREHWIQGRAHSPSPSTQKSLTNRKRTIQCTRDASSWHWNTAPTCADLSTCLPSILTFTLQHL